MLRVGFEPKKRVFALAHTVYALYRAATELFIIPYTHNGSCGVQVVTILTPTFGGVLRHGRDIAMA
jgi:hypothetical protein